MELTLGEITQNMQKVMASVVANRISDGGGGGSGP